MPYDKKWHMILSAVVCVFLGLLLPIWTAAVITLVLGVGKEGWDLCGNGTPEWLDLAADVGGIAVAVLLLSLVGGA